MKVNRKSVLVVGCGVALVTGCNGKLIVDGRARNLDGGSPTNTDASRASSGGDGAGGVVGQGASGGSHPAAIEAGTGRGGLGAASGGAPGATSVAVPTYWTGNPSDCPAGAPEEEAPCGVTLGQICAYYTQDGPGTDQYDQCQCLPATRTTALWSCSKPVSHLDKCPPIQPEEGSPYTGGVTGCSYPPDVDCFNYSIYDSQLPKDAWHCVEAYPFPLTSAAYPTSLDETKPVRSLTDADRQAWCEWYTTYDGATAENPVDPNGYTESNGCLNGPQPAPFDYPIEFTCRGAVAEGLSISFCKANLALSDCAAPVSDLSDCLLTVQRNCTPSPLGCGRYLSTPGCSGTIVTYYGGPGTDAGPRSPCSIRVRVPTLDAGQQALDAGQ